MPVALSRQTSRTRPHRRRLGLRAALAVALVVPLGATVVAPASAAPPVPDGAWTDGFDAATLDPRWTAVNDEPTARSLTTTPGALTLTALPGDTWQGNNSARNVMTLDIPDGDFSIPVSVQAPVATTFQGAGLIAYQDLDNYVRSGLTFVGGITPSGIAIENDIETAAIFAADHFEDRPGSTAETLRLSRAGEHRHHRALGRADVGLGRRELRRGHVPDRARRPLRARRAGRHDVPGGVRRRRARGLARRGRRARRAVHAARTGDAPRT